MNGTVAEGARPVEVNNSGEGWKRTAATVSAVLLGLIFLVSGGWKVLSPLHTGELLEQARVPAGWGPLGAAALGTFELLAAFLLFAPQFRKLGGLLSSGLMVFFLGWVAYFYPSLAGQECSCFPIIKRTVGPGFFIGDGVMLLFALAAWLWSPAVRNLRVPAAAFASLLVVAGASLGLAKFQNRGLAAPTPLVVDGRPEPVAQGKVVLFFYDPQCMHCDATARFMSKFQWNNARLIGIPTAEPQFAPAFLHDTGLKAGTSYETAKLRHVFHFVDPPYLVALVDGHQVAAFGPMQLTPPAPKAELEKLGFIR